MLADLTYRLNSLCNESIQVPDNWGDYIQRIRERRVGHKRPYYVGSEHPKYAWFLNQVAKTCQAKRILELGVQQGASAYGLCCDLPADGLFVGVDNEADQNAFGGMGDFVQLFPAPNRIFLLGDSSQVICAVPGHWDLVHFDHFKDRYVSDLDLLARRRQISCVTVCAFHDSRSFAECYVEEIKSRFHYYRHIDVPEGALVCWGLRE